MLVKVKDRKTGVERTVTQKAYAAMGPKVYEKLGFVDDNGNDIGTSGSPNRNTPQVSRSVKSAGPVVVKSQLVTRAPIVEPEPESETEQEEQPVKERRKPGPKPKNLQAPEAEKSISSNSDENEQ